VNREPFFGDQGFDIPVEDRLRATQAGMLRAEERAFKAEGEARELRREVEALRAYVKRLEERLA
jgi:hypothetical protein